MTVGRFITLEGSEGVGKSTNLAVLEDALRRAGRDVTVTREPGGTQLGEAIRQLLLGTELDAPMAPLAELCLMFAARAQHVTQVIQPALARGEVVLCDRFTDASFAYQGAGRGLPVAAIATLADLVHADLNPDVTFYLDLEPKAAFARLADRSLDRIEREELAFFERVRAGYLARATAEPARFVVVDAGGDRATVAAAVAAALADRMTRWDAE